MESLSIGGRSGRDSYEVNRQKEDDDWNFQHELEHLWWKYACFSYVFSWWTSVLGSVLLPAALCAYTHLRQVSTIWCLLNRWVFLPPYFELASHPRPAWRGLTLVLLKIIIKHLHFSDAGIFTRVQWAKKQMQNAWPALGHFHVPGTVNCSAQTSRQLSTRWVYPRPCDQGFWWWAYHRD